MDADTWAKATHHGHFLLLNLAMGGGFPDGVAGFATPTDATRPGGSLLVDHVAVSVEQPGQARTARPCPPHRPARSHLMITRRSLLGGLAAGAATASGIALAGRATGATAPAAGSGRTGRAAAGMPLHLVNNSGEYANSSVWLYIVGNDGTQQVRVTPDGELKPVALADNGAGRLHRLRHPARRLRHHHPPAAAHVRPDLHRARRQAEVQGGRGRQRQGRARLPGGLGLRPTPTTTSCTTAPSSRTTSGGMYCNTTMVDMFSVPLAIKLTGAKDQTTGTLKDGARAKIFSDVRAADGFGRLVIDDKRVIAPGHGLDSGLFAEDYFAPAIDEAWSAYAGKDLTVTTNAGHLHRPGQRRQAVLHRARLGLLRQAVHPGRPLLRRHAGRPERRHPGPVAAILGAALNRSTLASQRDTSPPPTRPPSTRSGSTNHYAKAMHAATRTARRTASPSTTSPASPRTSRTAPPGSITLTLTPF